MLMTSLQDVNDVCDLARSVVTYFSIDVMSACYIKQTYIYGRQKYVTVRPVKISYKRERAMICRTKKSRQDKTDYIRVL